MTRTGFTLAEVLVTLAVIGVVASLTIPALVKNIEKAQLESAFKKKYSEVVRTINLINNENGSYYACSYLTGGSTSALDNNSGCEDFYTALASEFRVIERCSFGNNETLGKCLPAEGFRMTDGTDICPSCNGLQFSIQNDTNAFLLADGTYLYIYRSSNNNGWHLIFVFDVNGFKKPNQLGKDVFGYMIKDNILESYRNGGNDLKILKGQDLVIVIMIYSGKAA